MLSSLQAAARLVTVVGPGGVGKTRLARQVGRAWVGVEAAPVRLVCLDAARDGPTLRASVAEVLGLPVSSGPPDMEHLGRILASSGPLLLVLDNLEQVRSAAAQAASAWLQAAPDLRLLGTSRERLRVPGERVFELAPLAPLGAGAALFIERAREACPGFEAEGEALNAVRSLVTHLDGLPLAIELAAARCVVLSPRQILDRLVDRGSGSLARGPRVGPPRQSSLDQAMRWSWELFTPAEQACLAQIAVFDGTFDLAAAEQVVALPPGSPDVLDLFQALREKSLLAAASAGDRPRFRMLVCVREFAGAKDADAGRTWGRHAAWAVARAGSDVREDERASPEAARGRGELHSELVQALAHLQQLGTSPALLAAVVVALRSTWTRTAPLADYIELIDQCLASCGELPAEVVLQLRLARLGRVEASAEPLAEIELEAAGVTALARDLGRPVDVARALLLLASVARRARVVDRLGELVEEIEAILLPRPTEPLRVQLAVLLGLSSMDQLRPEAALRHLRQALSLASRCGAPHLEPHIQCNIAAVHGFAGRSREKAAASRRALVGARELGQRTIERRALLTLADAESELGALGQAQKHCEDIVRLARADHAFSIAQDAQVTLAWVCFARGELDAAAAAAAAARDLAAHVRAPSHRAYIDLCEALVGWARWGSLRDACDQLQSALDLARGHLPHGSVRIESRLLAAQAQLGDRPRAALERGFDQLAERAGRVLASLLPMIAIDRLHLDLAEAGRPPLAPVRAALTARPDDVLDTRVSRVLLASALAARDLGHADVEVSA